MAPPLIGKTKKPGAGGCTGLDIDWRLGRRGMPPIVVTSIWEEEGCARDSP